VLRFILEISETSKCDFSGLFEFGCMRTHVLLGISEEEAHTIYATDIMTCFRIIVTN
jgi:hypothetical protein